MSSTNKTSLGLNMWEASDKPVRQDFVNDNVIIDEKITKLNSDLQDQIATTNSNLTNLGGTVSEIYPVAKRTAISMPDNTDYNTLNQPGWYDVFSTNTAVSHAPADNLGRMLLRVESANINNSWVAIQTAIEWYSSGTISPNIYKRWLCNANGAYQWTAWIRTP